MRFTSRGDQILNAASFESQGYSMVIREDDLTTRKLVDSVHELYFTRQTYIDAMSKSHQDSAIHTIIGLIEGTAAKKNA